MRLNNTCIEKNKYIYRNFNYWENCFNSYNNLFEGNFNNYQITPESKIIYTGILNSEKNIVECSFSVYPSIYCLLGFIQNIFLSTGFFTWYDTYYDDFYIPMDDIHTVISEVTRNTLTQVDEALSFIKSYEFLDTLWNLDEDTLLSHLINFTTDFNAEWDNDPEKKLFIKIFNSPEEIYPFVIETIGWDDEEFIEAEISMSPASLKNTCESVFSQPFINEKFIDILNINMPILF